MFLPENIDLAHSEKYNLSIRLAPNGFSFCIYCPTDPSIFHFQETGLGDKLSYIDHIKKLVFDLGFFSQPFNKTSVTIVSPHYTIVPDPFFDRKRIKEIFNFNFYNLKGVVLSDTSANGTYHIIYHVDEAVHSFLARHLWNPTFHHHISSLLNLFKTYKPDDDRKQCFLNFHEESVSIICFSKNDLLSANTFTAINAHDTSYYITSIWEKLAFNQESDILYLFGDTGSQKTVVNDLKKLIQHVEPVELIPKVILTEEQKETVPTDMMAALCV